MQGRRGFVGTGEFGAAVGRMLAGKITDLSAAVTADAVVPSLTHPSDIAQRFAAAAADVIIAVLWRPSPRLCERISGAAGQAGVAWLPAILSYPYISVGPLIRPGHAPCFRCLTRRQVQHSAPELPDECLLEAYDADPKCGPTGHLDCHARVTAGLIGWLLCDQAERRDQTEPHGEAALAGGRSWAEVMRFHLVSRSINTMAVWPWHGCPSCGAQPPPDPALRLRAALAGLPSGREA